MVRNWGNELSLQPQMSRPGNRSGGAFYSRRGDTIYIAIKLIGNITDSEYN